MSAPMVSVTVIDQDGASDFAAPQGTTVAGLCAMLAIDLTIPSVRLTHADGRPLDGAAVLGRELPSGAAIALSSRVLSAQQANEASARHENQWLSPVLALVGICFLLVGAITSLCLMPLVADATLRGFKYAEDGPTWAIILSGIPGWLRILCSLLCCAGALVPLFASRLVRSRPAMLLLMPALAGYSSIGLVSGAGVHALEVAPVVAVWVALITAVAVASLTGTPAAVSAILVWVGAVALVTVSAYPVFHLVNVAPLAVVVGVLLFLMAPRLALRVPDSQLVDVSSVLTIASRIRQEPAQTPSPVTGGRMTTALGHTEARNSLIITASSLFVLVGGIPLALSVVPTIDVGRGIGGFVLVIAAIITLLTAPRATRNHLGRILPRLSAAGLAAAFLLGTWVHSWTNDLGLYPLLPACVLILVGVSVAAGVALYEPKGHAALMGTILDFVQTFCTFLLLPAAFMASGLFEFAWRAVL